MLNNALEPWARTIEKREIIKLCRGFAALGDWGSSREFPVEQWILDAKLEELEGGTSDIPRLVISRKH